MKRVKSLYSIVADANAMTVTVTHSNGKKAVVDLNAFNPTMLAQAAVHGAKQKVGDAGAVQAGDDGKVSPDEKLNRVLAMVERLNAGDWNTRATGGTSDDTILIRALGLAYPGKSEAQFRAYVDSLKPAEKRALLAPDSPIYKHVESVRADAAAGENAEDVLAKFDAFGE